MATINYLTTTAAGARTLFGGNQIPASRLNTIAKNVLARYPNPTSLGDPFTNANKVLDHILAHGPAAPERETRPPGRGEDEGGRDA